MQQHRVQVDEETNGEDARSLLHDVAQEEGGAQLGEAQVKKGFSAYFTKLTRGRREVEKPARSSASTADPPPAEDIGADDIFVAVKTTKKFHQSRLNLLLDTWISRNMQQVRQYCKFRFHLCLIHLACRIISILNNALKILILRTDLLVCGLKSLLLSLCCRTEQ